MRSPLGQFVADHLSDPVWNGLALGCFILVLLILRARPRWREQDEAGHVAAEKKREQLKQTRRS